MVTCILDGNIKIIPLDDMFIAHHYKLKHETRKQNDWDIQMTLHRKNGKILTYHFKQSYADFLGKILNDVLISLNVYEMKDDVPCLLLMCAETQSIITKIHKQSRFKMMHVVTITEDLALFSCCLVALGGSCHDNLRFRWAGQKTKKPSVVAFLDPE